MHPLSEANMQTNNETDNEEEKKLDIVLQDMEMIKNLADNNKMMRDTTMRYLTKWFHHRNRRMPYKNEDFLRIWRSLFYATWMSDTPLIQVECAENISQVIINFTTPESSLPFFKCGLAVISTEWFSSSKFLMLVRNLLRQGFGVLKRNDWSLEAVEEFNNALLETVLKKDNSTYVRLTLYVIDIYLKELAKVSNGSIGEYIMTELLRPFVKYLSRLTDAGQIVRINKFIFHHLIRQSEQGIECKSVFEEWKERVKADGGELEEPEEELDSLIKPLDPITGHVDIELPQLEFDAVEVSKLMHEVKFGEGSTTKARKAITKLELKFEKLSVGVYPFEYKIISPPEYDAHSKKLGKPLNDSSKNRSRKRKNVDEVQVKPKRAKLDSVYFSQDKLPKFIEKGKESLSKGPNKRSLKSNKTKKVLHSNPEKKKALKVPMAFRTFKNRLSSNEENKALELPITYRTFKNHLRSNSGTWIAYQQNSLKKPNIETPINSNQTEILLLSNHKKKRLLKLYISNRTFKNHFPYDSGTWNVELELPKKKLAPMNYKPTYWLWF